MPPQEQNQSIPPIPQPPIIEPKSKHSPQFLIILAVLLILTGIFGVWFYLNPAPEEDIGTATLIQKDEFADWKTYKNSQYGFEIKYPNNFPAFRVESVSDTEKQEDGVHVTNGLQFIINDKGTKDDYRVFAIEIWPRDYFDKFMVISSSSSGFADGIVWDKRYQDEPGPEFISKDNDFVFAYFGSQDCPEQYCDAHANVSKILSTFKFTK